MYSVHTDSSQEQRLTANAELTNVDAIMTKLNENP